MVGERCVKWLGKPRINVGDVLENVLVQFVSRLKNLQLFTTGWCLKAGRLLAPGVAELLIFQPALVNSWENLRR